MGITIDLSPEAEAGLAAQGLSLQVFLKLLLEEQAPKQQSGHLSPSERAALSRDSAKNLPEAPLLSDGAIRRESFYSERG